MRAHLLIAAGCGLLTAMAAEAQTQAPPRGADRAPETIRPLLGAWDLEIPDQPRKCTVTLGVEEAPGGRQLRFPATCRRALPILDGAASWTVSPQGVPRVLDGSGKVLIGFEAAGNDPGFSGKGSDGKAYRLDPQNYPRSARRPTPSRPEVAATAAQRPTVVDPATAPRAETLPGLYALMRQVNREACKLVLTPGPTGSGTATFEGRCQDTGLAIFDPAAWRYGAGRLTLVARKGHTVELVLENGTWRKDPALGAPLMMRKLAP